MPGTNNLPAPVTLESIAAQLGHLAEKVDGFMLGTVDPTKPDGFTAGLLPRMAKAEQRLAKLESARSWFWEKLVPTAATVLAALSGAGSWYVSAHPPK